MIRHYAIDVDAHVGKVCGNVFPTPYDDLPKVIQLYFSGICFSPMTAPVLGDNGYEIRTKLRVVVVLQANRPTLGRQFRQNTI